MRLSILEKTFSYLPHTVEDKRKMLDFLNLQSTDDLFNDIPREILLNRSLDLPDAMSELSLERHMSRLAGKNQDTSKLVSFLGAGSYEHYIPSVVDSLVSRSEFYTSYTPYQPEISQGMLQAIFEYQTMVSEIMGTEIANASMYDGPTALAETGIVACSHTRRNRLLVARSVNPEYRKVLATYAAGQSIEIVEIPENQGNIQIETLKNLLDSSVAGVILQYPNYFGTLDDIRSIAEMAHSQEALLIVVTYPIAMGLLTPPGQLGADMVIAEGQSLGNAMQYGGPYLGILTARKDLMRKLPGRMVGQTKDTDGRRGFVLTLQAREQHIRRDKASSNICSNQALNALAATIYLSYMGPQGLRDVAYQCHQKAAYLRSRLKSLSGVEVLTGEKFFHEFVIRLNRSADEVEKAMLEKGFLPGVRLENEYEDMKNCWLIAVTEMRTKDELDGYISALQEVLD